MPGPRPRRITERLSANGNFLSISYLLRPTAARR